MDSLMNEYGQIFEIGPTEIKVHEELPRIRKEMGEVEKLLISIKRFGQMQPVVITREMELIAGGRRLAACLLGGIKVKACFVDTVDPITMKEMEIEENLQRKQLTPAEEVLALSELHKLKQLKYGDTVQGKKGGWGLEDTADLVGKSKGLISQDLSLAEMISRFPSLMDAPTKSAIKKAAKGIEKLNQRMEATSLYEQIARVSGKTLDIVCEDAFEHMSKMADDSVDVLITDPPYGIDIGDIAISIGNITGGATTTGFKYDDSQDYSLLCYQKLALESARFIGPTGHGYVFVAPENFTQARYMFIEAGWLVHIKPLIWNKMGQYHQSNAPHMWPASNYEMIMFMRKPDSRLVMEGKIDVISIPPVNHSIRMHQAEKPVELGRELLIRTSLPGQVLYDPFMGSGAFIAAGLDMKMVVHGCDKMMESYAATLQRLAERSDESK
jgi:ParB/RepB/Spo0J family partition protein